MKSNSWIIRNKETKAVVMETFDERIVNAVNIKNYEAIPTHEYLAELNAKIKGENK